MGADVKIAENDWLYRRILGIHIKDGDQVSSAAFKNKTKKPDPEPSVDLARLTTPQQCLDLVPRGMGLIELQAKILLSLGFAIIHAPVPDNSAHCVIRGGHTMETCRKLAEGSRVRIRPSVRQNQGM